MMNFKEALLAVYGNGTKSGASRTWAGKAAAAGYRNIVIYPEGFRAWKKNNMPVGPLKGGGATAIKTIQE